MVNRKLTQSVIDYISETMSKKGCTDWQVDDTDRRYVVYTCHCGEQGRHLKQNLKRLQWNGCSNCSKKDTSALVREKVTKILKDMGYTVTGFNAGRKVVYQCVHGEFSSVTSNVQKNGFQGGCRSCRDSKLVEETLQKVKQAETEEHSRLEKIIEVPILFSRSDWRGGNHKGSISESEYRIQVIFRKEQGGQSKSFSIKKYEVERARQLASNYRDMESVRRGLSTNMRRDVTVVSHPLLQPGYTFSEIYLPGGEILICENDHCDKLCTAPLRAFRKPHTTYATQCKKLVHSILYPEFSQVDHIDRNGLNNLRCNVREGGGRINATNRDIQKNNTSGHKGVRFEEGAKARWKAQWVDKETGKKCAKSFSVAKYGEEDAKKLAIACREEHAPCADDFC
jgi:hypothetical protein